jgi:uncharacterized protein YacL
MQKMYLLVSLANKMNKMNTTLWVMQALLALFFLAPAFIKLTSTRQQLIDKKMLKTDGKLFPVRTMGMIDLLAAVCITVPLLIGIFPALTPIAAVGICIVMTGAFILHSKRKEYKVLPFLAVAFILSLVVAYYRFQAI